jgi:hypothetical protein
MRRSVGGRHILGGDTSAGCFHRVGAVGCHRHLQLVRGVIESLTAATAGTAVVVGVDDVHLLDDLSTFVVQQIVQRDAAKVVLAVRDGEPIPTAVQEIWRMASSTGSLCSLCRSTTPPRCCRPLWGIGGWVMPDGPDTQLIQHRREVICHVGLEPCPARPDPLRSHESIRGEGVSRIEHGRARQAGGHERRPHLPLLREQRRHRRGPRRHGRWNRCGVLGSPYAPTMWWRR